LFGFSNWSSLVRLKSSHGNWQNRKRIDQMTNVSILSGVTVDCIYYFYSIYFAPCQMATNDQPIRRRRIENPNATNSNDKRRLILELRPLFFSTADESRCNIRSRLKTEN